MFSEIIYIGMLMGSFYAGMRWERFCKKLNKFEKEYKGY